MSRSKRDPNDMCTCDLEMSFSSVDDTDPLMQRGSLPWTVIDAECEEIASCKEERFSNLIAWSLNKAAGYSICPVHP